MFQECVYVYKKNEKVQEDSNEQVMYKRKKALLQSNESKINRDLEIGRIQNQIDLNHSIQ